MGWESRDWGQWTDEERETYLDGRERRQPLTTAQLLERLDSPYPSGISARVKIWGGLFAAIALLALFIAYERATAPTFDTEGMSWQPAVIYGWQHVPLIGSPGVFPTGIVGLPGRPILCTVRERDPHGRWACMTYSPIRDGQRVVVLPPSSPLRTIACNTDVHAACPGAAV
jgi:hypothetical protein